MTDVTPEEWFNTLTDVVRDSDLAVIHITNNNKLVSVKFTDEINTVELLDKVPDTVLDRTRLYYNRNNSINFKYSHSKRKDTLDHTKLLSKILSEDVPEKTGFKIEYDIYSSFISIRSPRKRPIQLFEHKDTSMWVFTGLYQDDGMYIQQFRQEQSRRTTDEQFKKLGEYRVQEILQNVSFNCQHCKNGTIEYTLQNGTYLWNCTECDCSATVNEDLSKQLNPLDSREKLLNTIKEQAVRSIGNHNLQKFETK